MVLDMMDMKKRIDLVNSKIENAAMKRGINKKDITLIAVSKTKPIEDIIEAKKLGLNVFGENKVQELTDKYDKIEDVSWHFIGKLQRNKVKYIIDKVSLIHSLDNIPLAIEINKRAGAKGIKASVLIQINIGMEESKSGINKEDLKDFLNEVIKLQNIKVEGLMAIPPKCSEEQVRSYFKEMKGLYDNLSEMENENLDIKYLSMGMTGDYEIAIEEGANIVRVGTGIFGYRNYDN